jgi:ABC-type amino acid transport substrate-binding protein
LTPLRIPRLALLACLALVACASKVPPAPRVAALRVAVPRANPPYAFRQEGRLVGLEVDFARELAAALGRPLQLVETDFTQLIAALRAGRADVAMGGLTITRARGVQIGFSDPYLRSGLLAVMRREDVSRFGRPSSVLRTSEPIGVVSGTTAERFVREYAPYAGVLPYPDAQAAINELLQRHVTLVVHDAPVAIWFASADEANLAVLLDLLNEEQLGWGLPPGDATLRDAVNGALARWRTDGTRDRILARWVPYWQRLEARSAAGR